MKRIATRILIMIMCVLFTLSMAACGGTGNNDSTTTAAGSENTTAAGESTTTNSTDSSVVGVVPESAAVDASYFDDAAFVGDSVSLKLSYYAVNGCLGNAQFFTAGSLGAANALWEVSDESVHPSYQGEKMLVEDCIAKSGAKKVYIMLGMNDLGLYGLDATVENYKTLVDRILAKSPRVQIVVQSMTPMTTTSTIIGENLNNANIKVYNDRLKELCTDNGWSFVDVASVMYDESGENLNREYCSDPDDLGVHFTEAGCKAWADYLKTHTP